MRLKRRFILPFLCLLTLGWLAPPAVGAATDPAQFLRSMGDRAVKEVGDPSLSLETREERFQAMIREYFDVPTISKLILGPSWRQATEEQRQAFGDLFVAAMSQRFLPIFQEYDPSTFTVGATRKDSGSDNQVFVTAQVQQAGGPPVSMQWRLIERGQSLQVLDVVAEGISLVVTLRQEYGSVARNQGVDGLIDQLRKKVEARAFAG